MALPSHLRSLRLPGAIALVAFFALSPTALAARHGHLPRGFGNRAVCERPGPSVAECLSRVVVHGDGSPLATAQPTNGYFPADLQSAYRLPSSTGGAGPTAAALGAPHHPRAPARPLPPPLPLCASP